MSQFEVPQNIDIESKIVGPLTLKQFGFVAAAFLICFSLFFVLTFGIWLVITIIVGSAGVSFAFIKVGGRPLYIIAFLAFKFLWQPKLFLWQRPIVQDVVSVPIPQKTAEEKRNALQSALGSVSNIGKLWQEITTRKTPIPKREKKVPQKRPISEIREQFQVFRRITGEKEVARRIDYR